MLPLRLPLTHGNSLSSTTPTRVKAGAIRNTPTFFQMAHTTSGPTRQLLLNRLSTHRGILIHHTPSISKCSIDNAGLYYPRGATLGGSSQINAMSFARAPDNEWDYIANLTGDASWTHEHMRQHFVDIENCTYVPSGTPGHGFESYIQVLSPTTLLYVPANRAQSSHVKHTPALAPLNVARYVQQIFAESDNFVPENIEHMAQLFDRDINRSDTDRYATPLVFVLPGAIYAGNRSSIANHINEAVSAGYPLTLSLHSPATRVPLDEQLGGKPKAVGIGYLIGEGLYSADS